MVLDNPQPIDQVTKLKADVAFWIKGVEQKQNEINDLKAKLAAVTTKDSTLDALKSDLKDVTEDKQVALALLRKLAVHVQGRTGMLTKSVQFCEVCQNAIGCPIAEVTELLGEI